MGFEGKKITSAARGWGIFLKVFEFLEDPFGGHGIGISLRSFSI